MYYIYSYTDPRTGKPFYIGKGKDNRKFDHLNSSLTRNENKDKCRIINEIRSAGLEPIIEEIETGITNELLAYNREDFYILKYGRAGIDTNGILTNKTLHGHPPKPIWTEEKKKRHSDWNKKYWTDDKKTKHKIIANANAIKGGLASIGTVSIIDLNNITKRIPKLVYLAVDKSKPVEEQEFVSTASKEGKRRLTLPTLGPLS